MSLRAVIPFNSLTQLAEIKCIANALEKLQLQIATESIARSNLKLTSKYSDIKI